MRDLIEQLWPAFEAELSEQLEQLEQELAGRGVQADVHLLFRLFHTIKSSSAMMDFASMEALAHAAEDLLEQLRAGVQSLQPGLVDTLLRTVDALRRQLVEAVARRQAPAAQPALVAELRAAVQGEPPADARFTAPPEHSQEAPADDSPLPRFTELAQRLLPSLAEACLLRQPLPESALALAALAEAAGLRVVARILPRLESGLDTLAELLSRLRHIENLGGLDAGTAGAYALLRQYRAADWQQGLAALRAAGERADLAVLEALRAEARLLGLAAAEQLLGLCTQVLRERERGALAWQPALAEQLGLVGEILAELPPELAEDAGSQAMLEQLRDNIVQALQAPDQAEAQPLAPDQGANYGLSPAMWAALSAAQRAELPALLSTGHALLEIEADLEGLADGGEAFVHWLSQVARPLANHTIFHGEGDFQSTQLCFLAACAGPVAELMAGLAQLDPEGSLLQLRVLQAGAAQASAAAAPAPAPAALKPAAATVRVDSTALDGFMGRVGELVMLRNMLAHRLQETHATEGLHQLRLLLQAGQEPTAQQRALMLGVLDGLTGLREQLHQLDARLQQSLDLLRQDVLALRVVPVAAVFNRMTRVVWGLAQAQGKDVQVYIQGEDTRIDKGLVDLLAEPLGHMVRNAVDHGLETPEQRRALGKPAQASLQLAASQQGNALLITVADDGRGLDLSRILAKARKLGLADGRDYSAELITDFIFAPGFSTAEQVSAVSGRGVGLDVVKTRLAQIGGQISVHSRPGEGARFSLRLPISVALQGVLLMRAGGRTLALPERQVSEVLSLPAGSVQSVKGQAACMLRGVVLPLYGLDQLLQGGAALPAGRQLEIVVFSDGRHRIGLVVERILGRQEVFVRDLHPDILRLPSVGGAAILGDGSVVIILDGEQLLSLASRRAQGLQELLQA